MSTSQPNRMGLLFVFAGFKILTLNLLALSPAVLEKVTCRSRGSSRLSVWPPRSSTVASLQSTNSSNLSGSRPRAILTQLPLEKGFPTGSFSTSNFRLCCEWNSSRSQSSRVLELRRRSGRPSCCRAATELSVMSVASEFLACCPTRCKPRVPCEELSR